MDDRKQWVQKITAEDVMKRRDLDLYKSWAIDKLETEKQHDEYARTGFRKQDN